MISINRKDLPQPNTTCQICGHKYYMCNKCLKLKRMGIEAWRQHCDCIECYQLYTLLNRDLSEITEEEYRLASGIILPDGHEIVGEMKDKMEFLKEKYDGKNVKSQDMLRGSIDKEEPLTESIVEKRETNYNHERRNSQSKYNKHNGTKYPYTKNNR